MIALLGAELSSIAETGKIDDHFLDDVIDFFRTYADRCHHGKEEDILFRELGTKPLLAEHKAIMDGLIEDHVLARNTIERLCVARQRYMAHQGSLNDVTDCIEIIIQLYPEHIEKEDKHFFFPSLQYLSPREQDAMLAEFREFNSKLIHEIYEKVIKAREGKLE
jgi:hemerythrin-like domain-containing protein